VPACPSSTPSKTLAKVAPAAALERSAVVVGPHEERLVIQGLARRIKGTDGGYVWVFSVPAPGSVVLTIAGEEQFRYEQGFFVPPQEKVSLFKVLSEGSVVRDAIERMCAPLISESPGFLFQNASSDILWAVHDLVQRMSSTHHGGLIVMLPEVPADLLPKYAIPESSRGLLRSQVQQCLAAEVHVSKLLWNHPSEDSSRTEEELMSLAARDESRDALRSVIESVGQLTAVDNALLLGPNLEFLGAGFHIPTFRETRPRVRTALDFKGTPGSDYDLGHHGSRHQAAASFAYHNPGGLVFIASEDGPLRCMLRLPEQDHVLLWHIRLPSE
jgi:hypothetical protein